MYQDETLSCRDCGKEFIFTASEQAFYAEKGFQNKPRRCPECRAAFRAANGNARPQREMFTAICADCGKCLEACPMKALKANEKVEIEIDGNRFDYIPLDTLACEWASRYVLTNRDGFDRMGATLNIMPDGKITVDTLADGLRQRDPLAKSRSGNAEKCITECPLTYRKYKE